MSEERRLGRILNFNVGVLGHVDSGKTSLARALSTVASTAAFDKVRTFEKAGEKNLKIWRYVSKMHPPPPPLGPY
jgi:translation elongation factor EF-Tu-like GTPase